MVELAFERIEGPRPLKTIAFLHGILGSGGNLRTIARRFVAARPRWTAWLVDLRGHGRSPKGTPDPSLEAAARDVLDLATRAAPPLAAMAGHSFGGKVALEALRIANGSLEHVLAIDSMPSRRSNRCRTRSRRRAPSSRRSWRPATSARWRSGWRSASSVATGGCASRSTSARSARSSSTTSRRISGPSSSTHRMMRASIS
ncbi:MAG: alpha/beta fold hydrolase [Deltaproteobacteria bacterium]|nr:MAG: alpha/beta fold hydrolase [Deltaproteobacteria bacterium]